MLPTHESITVEFKSDLKRLPDSELVLAVVCLANTDGGEIYLGVEDDGRVSGLHPQHQELAGLAAMVANNTTPSVAVQVEKLLVGDKGVARISVPRARSLVASTAGVLQRRRLRQDGTPECTPFLPHEFLTRQADLRLLDPSASPVAGARLSDLDPAERQRLRGALVRYAGEKTLAGLADEELDGALGLTTTIERERVPTLAGLLLVGIEDALRRLVPTHEVAYQVLEGTEVRVNKTTRAPLLRSLEELFAAFEGRVVEQELQAGLFRVRVPNIEPRVLREAVINAVTHRDYARLGPVRVGWDESGVTVSNPGGFVEGVTLENILRTEPRPRNPLLADALKRVGLAERTGRGVDLMTAGLLRFGRPGPDYGASDRTIVSVRLSTGEADTGFLRLVLEEEKRLGASLPVDTLIVLACLHAQKRLPLAGLQTHLQRTEASARSVVEQLVEAGLLEAHGAKKGRTYTLSARVYGALGKRAAYVRQAGIDPIRHEEMVRKLVRKAGRVKRGDVMELCGLSGPQATRLLARLVGQGVLRRHGARKAAAYEQGPAF